VEPGQALAAAQMRSPTIAVGGRGQAGAAIHVLEQLGLTAQLIADGRHDLGPEAVVVLLGSANWYRKLLSGISGRPHQQRPRLAVWHTEPLPPPRRSGLPRPRLHARELVKVAIRDGRATDPYTNWRRLRALAKLGLPDLLVVSTQARQEFLAEQGVRAHWVPLGYQPKLGRDLGIPRDIEVLFLGAPDVPRRRRIIRALRARGVPIETAGGWNNPAFFGEHRTRLLNRTRILLNLGRHPGELSGQRMLLGAANGALVVSEPIYRPAPYVPGRHYVSATLEELPRAIAYYLAHESERAAIAARARALVTSEVTLERSVRRIVALMREHGAPDLAVPASSG
jgi:hypothetical protein